MSVMDHGCHHPIVNLIITFTLAIFGEVASFINTAEIIKLLFQCFAWGGAGVVGVVSLLNWLQNNGWINFKRKK